MMKRILLVIALFLGALIGTGCERTLPVEEKDKVMQVRAGDLANYGYKPQSTEMHESFVKRKLFDGSYEVEYVFDTSDSEKNHRLYLYVLVTVARTTSDAVLSQGAERLGFMYGLRRGGIKEREIEDFYSYGNSSSFYVLEKEGRPIGNLFTAREGGKTYTLLITGLYFNDKDMWMELIEPKLRQFSAYTPDQPAL